MCFRSGDRVFRHQDLVGVIGRRSLLLEYGAAMGSAKAEGIHLVNAEQDTIGVDHAKIGALLCRKWKLPKLLGDAVLSHHFYENKKTASAGIKSILQVTNLSSLLVSVLYDGDGEEKKEDLIARAKEFFGFGPKVVEENNRRCSKD